jgi:preprotein translocase subunit SecA
MISIYIDSTGKTMISRTARKIHSYRGMSGRPRSSVATPHSSHASLLGEIHGRASQLELLTSAALAQKSVELKQRVMRGARINSPETVVQAFALAMVAVERTLGIKYYDVQLIAGLVLAAGAVAEIQTGEGKTIITALPAYLQALLGQGVHVATTNDYLSHRDCRQLTAAYELLNMSVGLLEPQATPAQKREAYARDITYGPGYEFGFDFLRDQLTLRSRHTEPLGFRHLQRLRGQSLARDQLVQRGHAFAIIDEADSVLIDEATTPLILSGVTSAVANDPALYAQAQDLVDRLEEEKDFEVDRIQRSMLFTSAGWDAIHQAFRERPPSRLARPWSKIVENALRAKFLVRREVDYVVHDGRVKIVDPNTGRIYSERTWRAGLHQAVEVREGLQPTPEKETQARITRQRYCHCYENISGLTGTARGGEAEFHAFYALPVVEIPTNRPCRRRVFPSRFFVSKAAKYAAIVADVAQRQQQGQPVLVGTRTIQDSKALAAELTAAKVSHTVLNGLQDATEASIVGQAGDRGRVTVATNMAGRGTDIRLDSTVIAAGGLHVIAAEFHQSRRVDRQLAGRAARQGDPGSCQCFASAEDEIISSHGASLTATIQERADNRGECPVDLTNNVRRLQTRLERLSLASRQRMVAHDQWLESVQSSLART